jgi:hypothetical protein
MKILLSANHTNSHESRKHFARSALEWGASTHSFLANAGFDAKRHEDVSHSQSFTKLSTNSLLFALISVICGLKFWSKNNKPAAPRA